MKRDTVLLWWAQCRAVVTALGGWLGYFVGGLDGLLTALLVRIKLGSPVLFSQARSGRNEKEFRLLKFRTMTDQRDENGKLRCRKTSPVFEKILADVIFPSGTVLPAGSSFSMEYGGRTRLWLVIRAVTTRVNGEFIQAAVTAVSWK